MYLVFYDTHVLNCYTDGSSPSVKDDFINRLLETGATESSSSNTCSNQKEENRENTSSQLKQTLCNLVAATNDLRRLKDELYPTALRTGLDKGNTSTTVNFSALVMAFINIFSINSGLIRNWFPF